MKSRVITKECKTKLSSFRITKSYVPYIIVQLCFMLCTSACTYCRIFSGGWGIPLARKISNHTSNNQATAMEETMRKRKKTKVEEEGVIEPRMMTNTSNIFFVPFVSIYYLKLADQICGRFISPQNSPPVSPNQFLRKKF